MKIIVHRLKTTASKHGEHILNGALRHALTAQRPAAAAKLFFIHDTGNVVFAMPILNLDGRHLNLKQGAHIRAIYSKPVYNPNQRLRSNLAFWSR